MGNFSIPNVLNPKTLEKQLKLVEGRLTDLQAEIEALTRVKEACQLLMQNSEGSVSVGADAMSKKSLSDLHLTIEDMLRRSPIAMSVEDIVQELRTTGYGLAEKKASSLVATALKKYPDIFSPVDEDRWGLLVPEEKIPLEESNTQLTQ